MFKKQIPSDTVSNRSIADKELKENTLVDTVPNKLLATLDTLVKGVGNNLLFRGANVIPDRIFAQTEDEAEQEKIDKLKKLALLNNTNDGQRLVKQDYDMNAKKILSAGGVDQYPEENLKNIYSALSDDDKQRLSKQLQEEEESKIMDIGGMTAGITRAEKVLGRGAGKVANAIADKIIDPTESGRAMRDYEMINDYLFRDMGLRKQAKKSDLSALDSGADRVIFSSQQHPNQVLKTPGAGSMASGNTIKEQAILNELNNRGLAPLTRSYVIGNKEFQTQSRVLPYGHNRSIINDIQMGRHYTPGRNIGKGDLLNDIDDIGSIVPNDVHDYNWGLSSPFETNLDEALKVASSKMSKTGEMHPDIVQANIKPETLELLKEQSQKMRVEPGGKIYNTDPVVFDVSRFGADVTDLLNSPGSFDQLKRTIKTTNPQVTEAMHMLANKPISDELKDKAQRARDAFKLDNFNNLVRIDGNKRNELKPFIEKLEKLAGENAGNKNYNNIEKILDVLKGPYQLDLSSGSINSNISKYNTNELIHAAANNNNLMDSLYKDDALFELYNRLMNKSTQSNDQMKLFGETQAIDELKFNTEDFVNEKLRQLDKQKAEKMIGDLLPITKPDTQQAHYADQLYDLIRMKRQGQLESGQPYAKENNELYEELRKIVGNQLKDRRREAYKKVKK